MPIMDSKHKCTSNNSCGERGGEHIRKPEWLKVKLRHDPRYAEVSALVREHGLHTICESGKCPNISECWSRGTATFMIGGDVCTRSCRFCATASGRPAPLDVMEPVKIARSVKVMGLRHAVITSVDRDDLADGGAAHWAATVRAIREVCGDGVIIELLIPDFDGRHDLLDVVLEAGADIVGHNMETVRAISPLVRSRARYETSLEVLRYVAGWGVNGIGAANDVVDGMDVNVAINRAKSGLMVGLGESREQVVETLRELAEVGVRRVTVGQYLRPTSAHYPVSEYVKPEVFDFYREKALELGFLHVESGPLVRSSYMAEQQNVNKAKVVLSELGAWCKVKA